MADERRQPSPATDGQTGFFARTSPRKRLAWGYFFMVLTALLWAGAWITAKVAALDAPPLSVSVGRFLLAAAALTPAWIAIGRPLPAAGDMKAWRALIAMAVLGGAIYNILFLVAEQRAPAADGGVIAPGFCAVGATFFVWIATRRAPSPKALAGLALSLVGATIVGYEAIRTATAGNARLSGDLMLAAAGIAFGAYTFFNRSIAQRVPAFAAVLVSNVVAALMLAPAALVHDGLPKAADWSDAAVFNVVYLGVFSTAFALTSFFLAVKLLGVERMAPTLGLVPLLTAAAASIFLDEPVSVAHVLGGALVLVGVALPAWRSTRPPAAPATEASAGS